SFFGTGFLYTLKARPRASAKKTGLAIRVSVAWLMASGLFAFVLREETRVVSLVDAADYVSVLLTGLWAEDFLFRGILVYAFERMFFARPAISVVVASVVAALAHLQYHHFALTRDAVVQVAATLPGCFLCTILRRWTGTVLFGGCVHLMNN